ncbi:hypothetical protein AB0B42_00495 [Streptomyces fradiae]|uniref:zinc finger domain-containing protein n=1 Tax=Streptomyces fradiae TaxID=1906 RepID=UPI0033E41368
MNPSEIPQLLAQIALADKRVRRTDPIELRAQIAMWAGILADVPYDAAIRYAQEHYTESTWEILPANIATRWAADVRDRMNRHNGTFEPTKYPALDPDDVEGYQTALRTERRAVAIGATPPDTTKALTAGPAATEVAERLAELGSYVPAHVREVLAELRPERAERERLIRSGLGDPLGLRCPHPPCGAAPGSRCTTNGRDRRQPHPSRVDAAQEARTAA